MNNEANVNTTVRSESEEYTIRVAVSNALNMVGISPCNVGYHYLRDAIIITIHDQWAVFGITKGLYPDIAKCYNTSSTRVESAMRHAIHSAWKRCDGGAYNQISGSDNEMKPANGKFIASVAEFVRLNKEINKVKTA